MVFSVIYRTLADEGLTPLQKHSRCILLPKAIRLLYTRKDDGVSADGHNYVSIDFAS